MGVGVGVGRVRVRGRVRVKVTCAVLPSPISSPRIAERFCA